MAVKDEAQKVWEKVQNMKSQYLSSDDLDMYKDGQMKFKVKDHTFRDVYARGNVDTSSPKTLVWLVPLLAVVLFQVIFLLIIPSILMVIILKLFWLYI